MASILIACLGALATRSLAAGEAPTLDQIREWNRIGHAADAERGARAALQEAERVHGPESSEVAEVLDELAVALRRGGKASEPEALEVCQRALTIKERSFGARDPHYATSLYNLGLLYLNRQDYAHARSALEKTLDIRKSALGGNHPDVGKSLLALGSVQHAIGNEAEGLVLTERAVSIEESALGPSNPERAYGLNSLATLRYSTGDFSGAIPLFEQAIALWEHAPTPNLGVVATCYNNLGGVYAQIGDYDRAVDLLKRALAIREGELGRNHPLVAGTLSILAFALERRGDLAEAQSRYVRAVGILERTSPRDPDLGWVRAKLGWLYLHRGDVTSADTTFRLALRNQEAAIGTEHPDLWMSLRGMAMVARRKGDMDAARGYYERTVALLRKSYGDNHPDLGRTLAEFASSQLAAKDSLGALRTALQAVDVNREHLRATVRGIGERQALLYTADYETGLDVALAALSGSLRAGPGDLVGRVWDAVVRSRAMVLDEMGERGRMVSGAGGVLETAKRLEGARNRLANLMVREDLGGSNGSDRTVLPQAREEVERAERDLASRSASFRVENDRAASGWNRVVSALPPGSGLVSYVEHGEDRNRVFLAFVLDADDVPHAVPLGSASEIERLARRWRSLAGSPPGRDPRSAARAEASCRAVGLDLRARIWDPIAPFVERSKRVLVIPDGILNLINIAALPANGSGYLVESPYAIHYLSAERDVVIGDRLSSHGRGLLAVGGALFDVPDTSRAPEAIASAGQSDAADDYRGDEADWQGLRSVRFRPLPETGGEAEDVAKLWGTSEDAVVLTGAGASERAVKRMLPGRKVAHFATHAFFVEGCPASRANTGWRRGIGGLADSQTRPTTPRPAVSPLALAGLAFAGANLRLKSRSGQEDGILTGEEIASLDLSGLDWAVLSACDTGVGDVRSGEGVLGLRRAFEVAGAGTLIMSLWPVEDASARAWMRLLYEGRFRDNLETAEAVREADLGRLRILRGQGGSTHPFFWGAFVAAGDWR